MPRLVILGAGGHGRAVADLAGECGWAVVGMADRAGAPGATLGDEDAVAMLRDGRADGGVVGVGHTALARRAALFELLRACGQPAPALVHPRATASRSSRLGGGTVVFAGCVIGAAASIGDNAVLYSGVLVEHDCVIADHAYLSPGVVLSGGVQVEAGAFLGAGAVVLPGVTIGKGAVVGAGGVVTADVAPAETVAGVPARPTRR